MSRPRCRVTLAELVGLGIEEFAVKIDGFVEVTDVEGLLKAVYHGAPCPEDAVNPARGKNRPRRGKCMKIKEISREGRAHGCASEALPDGCG